MIVDIIYKVYILSSFLFSPKKNKKDQLVWNHSLIRRILSSLPLWSISMKPSLNRRILSSPPTLIN